MKIENIFKKLQDIFKKIFNNNKKTIYILISGGKVTHWFLFIRLLMYLIDEYNLKIIYNLDNITKSDIVIPIAIESQTLLYKNQIYNIIDNKKLFYKHIQDNFPDGSDGIYLIPTYENNYEGINFFSKFIIKPFTGVASKNILFQEGFIYDIISKYSNDNQIQDIIKISYTLDVNFGCKDGEIIGKCCLKHNKPQIQTLDYILGFEGKYIDMDKIPKIIFDFCKKIIKNNNYNGFIHFEFIQDNTGKIYIMECNPRISGGIEHPLYFKHLIEPYINVKSKAIDFFINSTYLDKKVKRYDHFDFFVEYAKYKFFSYIT